MQKILLQTYFKNRQNGKEEKEERI